MDGLKIKLSQKMMHIPFCAPHVPFKMINLFKYQGNELHFFRDRKKLTTAQLQHKRIDSGIVSDSLNASVNKLVENPTFS